MNSRYTAAKMEEYCQTAIMISQAGAQDQLKEEDPVKSQQLNDFSRTTVIVMLVDTLRKRNEVATYSSMMEEMMSSAYGNAVSSEEGAKLLEVYIPQAIQQGLIEVVQANDSESHKGFNLTQRGQVLLSIKTTAVRQYMHMTDNPILH